MPQTSAPAFPVASLAHSETLQRTTTTTVTTAAALQSLLLARFPLLLAVHRDADTSVPIKHAEALLTPSHE